MEELSATGWGLLSGTVVAFLGLFGAIFKGRTDQSGKIMESWQAMNEQHLIQMKEVRTQFRDEVNDLKTAHKAEMKELRDEFLEYKRVATKEITALRNRVNEVETEFAAYRITAAKDILERDELIAGMRRNMSQSVASYSSVQRGNQDFQNESTADRVDIHDQIDTLKDDATNGH